MTRTGIREISEKQRRFIEAYLGEAAGNGLRACRIAGYSGSNNTLAVRASKNLTNPAVREAIGERIEKDPAVLKREQLLKLWTKMALDEEENSFARLKAGELLARIQGLFVDRSEIEVKGLTLAEISERVRKFAVLCKGEE